MSNALAYLGASISVMPYSLFKRLGLGSLKPIKMTIEMADKSMQSPKGIKENEVIVNGDAPAIALASAGTKGPIPLKTAKQKLARKNKLKAKKHYEDTNLKLLRSLPLTRNNITLIMRNKFDLDTLSMDDLYNNLKGQAFSSTYADDVIFSFFANQSNYPQLDNEDLEQIDTDDLEEMDLKWQVVMLTIRVKNLKEDMKETKFQWWLYWSFQAEEGVTNFALMAYTSQGSSSSSSSESEVHTCSKDCLKSYETLPKQYDQQHVALNKSNLEIIGYQIGLESLKARIVIHEKNKAVYEKDIAFLNAKDKAGLGYDSQINESEVVHSVFNSRESDVDDSPVNDRFKTGKGFHAVPPPYTGNYMPSRPDLSFAGAAATISTTRPVNIVDPKLKVNDALPKTYSYFKAHSPVRRAFNQKSAAKTNNLNEKVKTARVNNVTTAGPKAVVNAAVGNGENVCVKSSSCWILRPTGNVIDHNSKDNGSYMLKRFDYVDLQGRLKAYDSFDLKNVVPSRGLTCLFAKATIDESNLWHRRLGHINFKTMNKLVRGNLVRGLPSKLFENDHTCVALSKGKPTQASCKTKLMSSISQPLQMLHIDLFGPTSVKSINHKTYCLVVTDDYSSFDNGTEFKNNDMNQFCGIKGIKREFSVTRTLQQNGVAKRKNMTLIEAARTMLADSLLPTTFWAKAVSTACYVQNRVLVTKPHNKTPYELLHGRPPSISFMRPFGCLVTILNTLDTLGKFDKKAVTVGNQTNKNACIKDNVDAVPTQQYIMLPLLYDSPQSSKDAVAADASKKTNEEPAHEGKRNGQEKEELALNKENDQNVQDFRAELDNLVVQQKEGFIVYQMDVKSAFLYGTIKKEVYVCQPPGFEDPQFSDKVYKMMHKKFQMSSIGELTFFLGLQVMQKDDGIFISQDKYVADILKKFDFVTVKIASTPIETNKAILKDEETEDVDVHLYRSMIGSLMYLTASRPDIIYLKCQPKLGLWYPRDSPFDLEAFSDSDCTGASLDRKSTIGGCQFLGKRLILWQCKKQTIVANSTTEAEYVAAANCCGQMRLSIRSGKTEWKGLPLLLLAWKQSRTVVVVPGAKIPYWRVQKLKLGLRLHLNSPMIYLSQELTHLEVGRTAGN
ncbi:putative ribonuclease H-like domain-containing protein [Tanacetum coccineum]